jgi:hypothetical protein
MEVHSILKKEELIEYRGVKVKVKYSFHETNSFFVAI